MLKPRQGASPPAGEPGVLEEHVRQAGLTPERTDEVEVPYEFPDRATLEQALLAISPVYVVGPEVARRVVRETIETAPDRSGESMARTGSRTGSAIWSPRSRNVAGDALRAVRATL